jgi:hypothetical protein
MFVPDRPFQPSLLFVGKVTSLPTRVEHLKGDLLGLAPALPAKLERKACLGQTF